MLVLCHTHTACKRKEEQQTTQQVKQQPAPKKPRLVFTDLQRRTLQAIFKETKRPSKEMQITISQQLGLDLSTVGNFFMNARRRSQDKWLDDNTSDADRHSSMSNSGSGSPMSDRADLNDEPDDEQEEEMHESRSIKGQITGQPTSVVTLGVVTSTTSCG